MNVSHTISICRLGKLSFPLPALWVAAVFLALSVPTIVLGNDSNSNRLLIRAGLITKIPNFVNWPDATNCRKLKLIQIHVLRSNPILKNLEILSSLSDGKEKTFEASRINSLSEASPCSFVYLTQPESGEVFENLVHIKKQSVFVIGYDLKYPIEGVHLNIFKKRNKFRFEYSQSNIDSANFSISHKLLKLARKRE